MPENDSICQLVSQSFYYTTADNEDGGFQNIEKASKCCTRQFNVPEFFCFDLRYPEKANYLWPYDCKHLWVTPPIVTS